MYGLMIIYSIYITGLIKQKTVQGDSTKINIASNIINKKICFCCFLLIYLTLALRHQTMGVDLKGYLSSFEILIDYSWGSVFELESFLNYEKGYVIFNKLIGSIYANRQFFLAVCALIPIASISYIIYKYSKDPLLSFIIFLGLPVFLINFSGLRQAIAIGICFFSFKYINAKKVFKFLCTVLLATTFHSSAILFLAAYPIYYIKLNKVGKLLSVFVIPIIYYLRIPLFTILAAIIKPNIVPVHNDAFELFVVFTLIYIFMLIMPSTEKREIQGYRNLFYVACLLQAMGGVHTLVIRVGYYFMIFLPLALTELVFEYRKSNKRESYLIYYAIFISFLLFGLYSIYTSTWAQAYPYKFFWNM